jgi:hypothetical protein
MGLSHTTILCDIVNSVSQRVWFSWILLTFETRFVQRDHREQEICAMMGICVAPHCDVWFGLQTASLQIVVGLQQFLMATRSSSFRTFCALSLILYPVYALFEASRPMLILLTALFLIQHMVMAVFAIRTYPTVTYNHLCILTSVSDNAMGIG